MKKATYIIQVTTFDGRRSNYKTGFGNVWVFPSSYVANLVASDIRQERKFASVSVIDHF